MNSEENPFRLLLVIYLLVAGIGSAAILIINFPTEKDGNIVFPHVEGENPRLIPFGSLQSTAQGLLALAFLAGVAGSFIHAAQSLSSYVGNSAFKKSWAIWYFLRPWIGGTLALTLYLTIRAGLVAGTSTMNPYGIAALGVLGGWFSKITTDKLQEVFETFFKTDQDKDRKDKLTGNEPPVVEAVNPATVPAGHNEIVVLGRNFQKGATVLVDGHELKTNYVSSTELKVLLDPLPQRPASGAKAAIQVKNPQGIEPISKKWNILFE